MASTISKVQSAWNLLVTNDNGVCSSDELSALQSIAISERTGRPTQGAIRFLKDKYMDSKASFEAMALGSLERYLLSVGYTERDLGLPVVPVVHADRPFVPMTYHDYLTLGDREKLEVLFPSLIGMRRDLDETGIGLHDLADAFSIEGVHLKDHLAGDASLLSKALQIYSDLARIGFDSGAEQPPDVQAIYADGDVWGYAYSNSGDGYGYWDMSEIYDRDFNHIAGIGYVE